MVKDFTNPLRERPLPLGSLLSSTAQHLLGGLDDALARAGLAGIRSAHAPLFLVIDPEGTRSSELAKRAGMTKQAMGEQVRHLERLGYVEVVPDPSDGRARLVRLTGSGWKGVEIAESVITRFDAWLEDRLGAEAVTKLRATLGQIIASEPSEWDAGPARDEAAGESPTEGKQAPGGA